MLRNLRLLLLIIFHIFCRHLIGFFLFLFLTIYTATKAPDLMDLSSLQRLSDMIRRADLHKIHPELLNCLPSLAFPSMDFLSSVSGNISELLANCLPDRVSHGNQTEHSVLVLSCSLIKSNAKMSLSAIQILFDAFFYSLYMLEFFTQLLMHITF